MSIVFIGADPDTQHAAIARVNDNGRPEGLWIIKHKGGTGPEGVIAMTKAVSRVLVPDETSDDVLVVAVEGQQIDYASKKGVRPQSLIPVAQVAGGILTALQVVEMCEKAYLPFPSEWKGQVPKQIHQTRIYRQLGWESRTHGSKSTGYARPTMAIDPKEDILINQVTKQYGVTGWKHLGDAIGLALWAKARYESGK